MKRGGLQIIRSLTGLAASFSALALLILMIWVIFGLRIGYSFVDNSGGSWMACGSLYSDPKWPLYLLLLFGAPTLTMTTAIYCFRYCSRQLDGAIYRLEHQGD